MKIHKSSVAQVLARYSGTKKACPRTIWIVCIFSEQRADGFAQISHKLTELLRAHAGSRSATPVHICSSARDSCIDSATALSNGREPNPGTVDALPASQGKRGQDAQGRHSTGTVTNVCCESTARDAMMLNFRTIMVSDGNAAANAEEHNASLIAFYLTFGDVMDTDFVIQRLERGAAVDQAAE
jgi:Isochorismatase family